MKSLFSAFRVVAVLIAASLILPLVANLSADKQTSIPKIEPVTVGVEQDDGRGEPSDLLW